MKSIMYKLIFLFSILFGIANAADYPNIPNGIDKNTFCGKEGEKFGHVIILLDLTTDLKKPQIDSIKDMVFSKNFYNKFEPFTKFSYLLIDNNRPQEQKFIFSKCRPKTGIGAEKNTWRENSKIIQKFYNDFISEAQSIHSKVYNKAGSSDNTFIYETFAYVFQNPKFDFNNQDYKKRSLVIVSDMMQHSNRLSFYSACNAKSSNANCPTFNDFKKNLSDKDYLTATSPNGKGIDLELYYLNHRNETNKALDRSLIKLWENYFKDRGFNITKIQRQLDIF